MAGVDRAGPAQATDQFSAYLPYAIVFGLTEQWTRTFALVGAPPQTPPPQTVWYEDWYNGRELFPQDQFPSRIDHFVSSSAATLSAPPPAVRRASGFGGGDFWGGGGGGSSGGGGGGSSW